jgi:hypothetical protein
MTARIRPRSGQITVRLPADVAEYVAGRAQEEDEDKTSVVVAALRDAMRRHDAERERAILSEHGGNPYPDLPPADTDAVAGAWQGLDW